MSAELLALFTSLAYATANVSARAGLRYSTANTATLVSLVIHATGLSTALLVAGSVPNAPALAIFVVVLVGVLQVLLRFCHYAGIARVGVSRAVTLRNTYPLLSVLIGITLLGEHTNALNLLGVVLIVVGTGLTSWRMDEHVPSFRSWYLVFPITTAVVTAAAHPLRRFAMTLADEPVFFAAIVGTVSLSVFLVYLALPFERSKLVWHRRAILPFVLSGTCEMSAVLLLFSAFALGPVVVVSPIAATSPIWTVIFAGLFLRSVERINSWVVFGTLFVVSGAIFVTLGRYWSP